MGAMRNCCCSIAHPPCYSPSQTDTWLTCPVKRQLRVEGWEPRCIGKPQLSALLGSGMHEGLAMLLKGYSVGEAIATAGQGLQQELDGLSEQGYILLPEVTAQADSLVPRLERALQRCSENFPLSRDWHVKGIELKGGAEYGNCRIDVAGHDGTGPAVLDWKIKLTYDRRWEAKDMSRYQRSWQMRHYAWFYGHHIQEPVRRYHICQLVLEPRFESMLWTWTLTEEEVRAWEESAGRVWQQMATSEPWMVSSHETVYGPCEYVNACFACHRDPALMQGEYLQRPRMEVR